jgi:hypothetical protein
VSTVEIALILTTAQLDRVDVSHDIPLECDYLSLP